MEHEFLKYNFIMKNRDSKQNFLVLIRQENLFRLRNLQILRNIYPTLKNYAIKTFCPSTFRKSKESYSK